MLRRFFSWWLTELASLLPAGMRGDRRQQGSVLCLEIESGGVRISHREDGVVHALGEVTYADDGEPSAHDRELLQALTAGLRPESTRCESSVAPGLALVKEIDLPAAAQENLHQVIGFEMQRLTPFTAEEVYFQHEIAGRRGDRLQVRIAVVPRHIVDRAIGLLAHWNLKPAATLGTTPMTDAAGGVTLGFRDPGYREPRGGGLRAALWLLNLALVGTAVAVPVFHERSYLADLQVRVAAARSAAETAAGIADEVDQLRSEAQFLVDSATRRVSMVELLEELSARLPDQTWVFRMDLREATVHVHGSSTAASSLIATLEDSASLSNVRFASPVLREGNTGRDRFHITAEIGAAEPGTTAPEAGE